MSSSLRLVSLCPSLTELLYDLGAGRDVVGRTKFCVHPRGWVEGIESVGGTKNPKIERILALAPDLVLMNEEENRREDADALRAAGIAVLSSMPRTVEETAEMVRTIADAVGRGDEGARIASDIHHRAAHVRRHSALQPAVSYAYLIWREPWMTVNGDTFVSAMLGLAGGRNVFATADSRYPEVSLEAIGAAAPDVVLLSSEPFPFRDKHVREVVEGTGIAEEAVVHADGELLSWHGSRTPAGIDYADALLAGVRERMLQLPPRPPSGSSERR